MKVFVDTNIILDLLARRGEFYCGAAEVFSQADLGEIHLNASSLCLTSTHYMLNRHLSASESTVRLKQLKVLVKVVGINEKIINLELSDDSFRDYEDVAALQLDDNWFLFANEMSLRCSFWSTPPPPLAPLRAPLLP